MTSNWPVVLLKETVCIPKASPAVAIPHTPTIVDPPAPTVGLTLAGAKSVSYTHLRAHET